MGKPESLPKALDLLEALRRAAQNKPIFGELLDRQRPWRPFDHWVRPSKIGGLEDLQHRLADGCIGLLQTISYKDVSHQGYIWGRSGWCRLLPCLPKDAHTFAKFVQPS